MLWKNRGLLLILALGTACQGEAPEAAMQEAGSDQGSDTDQQAGAEGAQVRVLTLGAQDCPPDPVTGDTDTTGPERVVDLGSGTVLSLQDCLSQGDGWVEFSYQGRLGPPHLHLIRWQLYEGDGWMLLDDRTDQRYILPARPKISPDSMRIASASVDLEAGYNPNLMEIWRIEGDSLIQELSLDGGLEWGPSSLSWLENDLLEFWELTIDLRGPALRYDSSRVQLRYSNGRWDPTDPTG